MFGNSIGITGRSRDTAVLHRELVSILGADLIGLYIPEDILTDDSGNITSWKARIGNNLSVITAAGSGSFKNNKTLLNGKDGIYPSDYNTTVVYFSGSISNFKYILSLVNIINLPFAQYETIVRTTSPATAALESYSGQSYLRSSGSWSHYVDGILTDNCTTGTHILEATNSTAHNGVIVAGNGDGTYEWRDGIGLLMFCSSIPTSTQISQIYEIVGNYYGLNI